MGRDKGPFDHHHHMPPSVTLANEALLPVAGQASVVFLALWWVAWERRAAWRAALLAVGWAVLQLALLSVVWQDAADGGMRGFDPVLTVLVLLPLPAVFLLAWRGMRASAGRAYEAVGLLLPAILLALYLRGYDIGVMLVSLTACFLSFYLPGLVANNTHRTLAHWGMVRLAFSETSVYWLAVFCCVMLRHYLPAWHTALTWGGVIGVPAFISFWACWGMLHFSVRGSLLMALLTGLLLPLMWIVCSMLSLY